jgi:hypothetical protein
MNIDLTVILMLAATVFTGLLAGASLDKSLVQLPVRRRLGAIAFADFSRTNDLGNGLIFYPMLGVGAALLTIVAALAAVLAGTPLAQAWPLYVAALLALLHTFTTTRAAPNMLILRQLTNHDETKSAAALDRFARWHNIRAVVILLNFVVLVWAVVTYLMAA